MRKAGVGNPGGHAGAVCIHRTDWHPSWAAWGKEGWLGGGCCVSLWLYFSWSGRPCPHLEFSLTRFQRPNKGMTQKEPEECGSRGAIQELRGRLGAHVAPFVQRKRMWQQTPAVWFGGDIVTLERNVDSDLLVADVSTSVPPRGWEKCDFPGSPVLWSVPLALNAPPRELRRVLSVCPFVSEQTLTQDGPAPGAGLQAVPCVRACVRAKWSGPENRGSSCPSALEVGGGVFVSFPAQSRAEKQKNKSSLKKNRKGKPRACERLSQDACL